ncbi:MAG: hypothetical protein IPM35_01135 [Myxococcales bacterium]|nr:hypothetical protein [Myxococcales bacterium]
MSEQDREARLPKPFEAMLEGWPVAERDDAFWDDGAEKITERLESARGEAAAHSALLEPPLPAEAGEPGFERTPKAEEPPPRSLAELARMSLATEAPKSGATDLALASLSLANGARASSPLIAEAETAARASAPAVEPVAAAAPVQALPVRRPQRSAAGPLAMAAIGLMGLAAAAVIVVRAQRQGESSPIAAAPPSAAPAAVAAQPTATATAEDIVALDDLSPGKAAGAAAAPRPSGEKVAAKAGGQKPEEPPAPEAKPAEPPAAVAKAEEKKDDEAAKLMKPAATAGDLPDKPSTGAVQAAIGSVMGSARACVAGHDEDSRATITFGSDGRVSSVAVSGKAAGTPAEACIKAALGKARVQPFARPSFSVGAAIRP